MKTRITPVLALLVALLATALLPATASAQSAFFQDLLDKETTTLDDGLRAMLVVVGEKKPPEDFDGRLLWATLQRPVGTRTVSAEWDLEATAPLTRGQAAFMLAKTLDLRGGVVMRLLHLMGRSFERYALREVEDLGLLDPGPTSGPVSGRELLGAVRRALEYAQKLPTSMPAARPAADAKGKDAKAGISLVKVKGTVQTRTPKGKWGDANEKTGEQTGRLFQTGTDGRLALGYTDESVLQLRPLSHLRLDAPPSGGQGEIAVALEFGSLEGKVGEGKSILVRTPHLVAVVRGGSFRIEASDQGSTIHTVSASATVRGTTVDRRITLGPGQMTDDRISTPYRNAHLATGAGTPDFLPPWSDISEAGDPIQMDRVGVNASLNDQRQRPGRQDLLRERGR